MFRALECPIATTEKARRPRTDVELGSPLALGAEGGVEAHDTCDLCRRQTESICHQLLHPPRHPVKGLLQTEKNPDQTFPPRGRVAPEFVNQLDHRRIEGLRTVTALGPKESGVGDTVGTEAFIRHHHAFLTLTDTTSWASWKRVEAPSRLPTQGTATVP